MDCWEYYKPIIVMLALQLVYSGLSLITAAGLAQGLSPRVFVIYRQAIATVNMVPISYNSRRKAGSRVSVGMKSLALMFIASLFGVTFNQILYFEGMHLASASVASAMYNLLPGVTFLMTASVGLEKLEMKRTRSWAKVIGTIICVIGAISMALLKGPKLLNMAVSGENTGLHFSWLDNWVLGCFWLFGSSCCWSLWLVLQVPISACYPCHVSLTAWICFFATIQCAILGYFLEPSLSAWKLSSSYSIFCCFYAGITSAVAFYVQAWCISKRGPLFSVMFHPLATIIVTVLAYILLHEKIYVGSLIGAIAIVVGLYAVLWGKAVEYDQPKPLQSMPQDCLDIEEPPSDGKI